MPERPAKPSKGDDREVISLEEDETLPDGFGLERFMEEINILELEGIYFSPNRKALAQRVAQSKKPKSLKQLYDEPVTITLSEYGQPGEEAYKVLQAAFLMLYQQGPETEGRVLFSGRELGRLVGKSSHGGTQNQQMFKAIMQLRSTRVTCSIKTKEIRGKKVEKKSRAVDFEFFSRVAFEGTRGRFAQVAVEVDSAIVNNFKNRHVACFNFERMQGLDMVGMMLYKRFFRHLANIYRDGMDKNALKFEKDYEQVCSTWLGLKPRSQKSRIEAQLGKRFEALKARRLLRDCRIEEKVDGSGFKIVGYAGSGFFRDYESIYRRSLPSPAPQNVEPEPLMLVADFHRQLGHNHDEFSPKEVAYARELQKRYSPAEVLDLRNFALHKAAETKFDMQWVGALSLYEGAWLAVREQVREADKRQEVIAACRLCNEHGFLEFVNGSVSPCPHDQQKVAVIHAHRPVQNFPRA